MGRLGNFRDTVANLVSNRESQDRQRRERESEEMQSPKGFQEGDRRGTGIIRGSVLEHEPPRDELHEYWESYENIGLIKSAINNFASEVIEPGWYVTADSQDTAEEVADFLESVGILSTEENVNFGQFIYRMIIEREVRGTVFMEKVTDDEGRHKALYPLQSDTITIYTKPGKAILPDPEADEDALPFDNSLYDDGGVRTPTTDDGHVGAYVQFDDIKPIWSHANEVVYTKDEVMKWVRDPDIGEPYGTSRIESIQDRADGWLQKVNDNDSAVHSKAWPQILFMMGTEDNPWSEEEVTDFVKHYDDENIEPGLMQAVSGDVDVEEFAGETADISDALEHDINAMMAGLPGPVYATGGFSQNVAPAVAQAQERIYIKEVKFTRRRIEDKFTPYLRDVAEDWDLDAPDSVELHLGRPGDEVAPEDVRGSIIQYNSNSQGNNDNPVIPTSQTDVVNEPEEDGESDGNSESDNQTTSGTNETQGVAGPMQTNRANRARQAESASFDGHDESVAELADPRLVSTTDVESELTSIVSDVLRAVRNELVSEFDATMDSPLQQPDAMESLAERTAQDALDDVNVDARTRGLFENVIEDTLDTIGQENHPPTIDTEFSSRHRSRARFLSDNMSQSVSNVVEDMVEYAGIQIRQAVQHNESPRVVAERIRNQYTDNELDNRAQTMARIEAVSAVNSVKLDEYERHPDVGAITLVNPCNENTTDLCDKIACESGPIADLDSEQTPGEQFASEVDDELLFDGFDPLPAVPPYHFGCRTEIVPAMEAS